MPRTRGAKSNPTRRMTPAQQDAYKAFLRRLRLRSTEVLPADRETARAVSAHLRPEEMAWVDAEAARLGISRTQWVLLVLRGRIKADGGPTRGDD